MSGIGQTKPWRTVAVVVPVFVILLVGCVSGSPPASTPSVPPSSRSGMPAAGGPPSPCHTGDLRASIGQVSAASGRRKADIYLTNVSNHACTLEGYPGVQPAQTSGAVTAYPVKQSQNPGNTLPQNQDVHPVTLDPSMTAHAVFYYFGQWSNDAEKKTCVNWSALAITPPGEHDNLLIPNSGEACVSPFVIGPIQE